MRTIFCIAASFLAAVSFGTGARALTVAQGLAQPALKRAAKPSSGAIQTRHRRNGGTFSNWCDYNCYAVPRSYACRRLGQYGHSRYAYDEDLPARYRWDHEASPTDNADAFLYRFTGEPAMRFFERIY